MIKSLYLSIRRAQPALETSQTDLLGDREFPSWRALLPNNTNYQLIFIPQPPYYRAGQTRGVFTFLFVYQKDDPLSSACRGVLHCPPHPQHGTSWAGHKAVCPGMSVARGKFSWDVVTSGKVIKTRIVKSPTLGQSCLVRNTPHPVCYSPAWAIFRSHCHELGLAQSHHRRYTCNYLSFYWAREVRGLIREAPDSWTDLIICCSVRCCPLSLPPRLRSNAGYEEM